LTVLAGESREIKLKLGWYSLRRASRVCAVVRFAWTLTASANNGMTCAFRNAASGSRKWRRVYSDFAAFVVCISRSKTWPDSPRALSGRLRRAATFLRKIGIEIAFKKEGWARTRLIHISSAPENAGAQPSVPSTRSAPSPKATVAYDCATKPLRTIASNENGNNGQAVGVNRVGTDPRSAADDADAKSPFQTAVRGTGMPGWRGRL
jgi:hypothetical protein